MAQTDRKKSERRSTYRVRAGHHVTVGEVNADGENVTKGFGPGEEVELTDEQAKAMPWAVESGERRRSGQTSRLKAKIADLEGQLKAKEEADKNKDAGKKDPGLAEAEASLRARGDNFMARGEPEVGKVPRDVEENFDGGIDDGSDIDPDDAAGGMKGMARERARGSHSSGTDTDQGGGTQT